MRPLQFLCTAFASLSVATNALCQTNFPEIEPNSQKIEATPVLGLVPGDTITGTSTGFDNTIGSSALQTVDVYRVKTAPAALGIYKHTLTLTTGDSPDHSTYLRGVDQFMGVVGTADIIFQWGSSLNIWYGFGKQEQIVYEVEGMSTTTGQYVVTYTMTPVTPAVVPGVFTTGSITVTTAGQGHGTDTELYIYDSNLNPIPLGHHDGYPSSAALSTVTLTLPAGTYYIANSTFNTSNNQSDLAPTEGFDSDNLLEFPDAMANNTSFWNPNISYSVSDGLTTTSVPAVKAGDFDIYWAVFTVVPNSGPPINDNCANAVTLGGTAGGTTSLATNDGAASCDPGGAASRDVWFTITNPSLAQQLLSLDTCGSAIDTVLSVHSACGGSELACNEDCGGAPCAATSSCLSLAVNPGQTVKVRVSDKGLAGGLYTLHSKLTPLNDDCTNPAVLAGPGNYAIDTTDATTGAEGQGETLCDYFGATAVNKDLWYVYTPTQNGTITVSTCGLLAPGFEDSKIAVYAGASCPGTGTAIACEDDNPCTGFSGLESTATFATTCGQTYLFQIGYYGNFPGGVIMGQFSVSETGAACATPATPFCLGDGTGTPCPCSPIPNNGAPGHGCGSQAFPGGAILSNVGIASDETGPGTDTLRLIATNIPGPALFIQSNGIISPLAFGDGQLCAAVGIIRLGVVFPGPPANPANVASYPGGLTPNEIHLQGFAAAGQTKHYQAWYRSVPGVCTAGQNYDLTQGLSITWGN